MSIVAQNFRVYFFHAVNFLMAIVILNGFRFKVNSFLSRSINQEVGIFKRLHGLRLRSSTPNSNPSVEVACFGEILFDCIFDEDCTVVFEIFPGGAPANVACALSKLGLKSTFVGCVGDDEDGRQLLNLLQNIGVDSQFCVKTESYPTRKVMVARKANGDREFAGFWDNASTLSFADVYYSPPRSSWERFSELITSESLSAVVVGTLGLAYESPTKSCMESIRTMLRSIENTKKRPLFIVDINWRPVFWDLNEHSAGAQETIISYVANSADIVKLTDEEAVWLLGSRGITAELALQQPQTVFQILQPKLGVLVSAGERGASCYFPSLGESSIYVPAFAIPVEETTGAGDAFLAAFIYHLLKNPKSLSSVVLEDIRAALLFASAAGALTCTRKGAIAAQPSHEEIARLLNIDKYTNDQP